MNPSSLTAAVSILGKSHAIAGSNPAAFFATLLYSCPAVYNRIGRRENGLGTGELLLGFWASGFLGFWAFGLVDFASQHSNLGRMVQPKSCLSQEAGPQDTRSSGPATS